MVNVKRAVKRVCVCVWWDGVNVRAACRACHMHSRSATASRSLYGITVPGLTASLRAWLWSLAQRCCRCCRCCCCCCCWCWWWHARSCLGYSAQHHRIRRGSATQSALAARPSARPAWDCDRRQQPRRQTEIASPRTRITGNAPTPMIRTRTRIWRRVQAWNASIRHLEIVAYRDSWLLLRAIQILLLAYLLTGLVGDWAFQSSCIQLFVSLVLQVGPHYRVIAKFHYTDTDTDPHGTNGVSPQKSPCPCRACVRVRVVEFSYYRTRTRISRTTHIGRVSSVGGRCDDGVGRRPFVLGGRRRGQPLSSPSPRWSWPPWRQAARPSPPPPPERRRTASCTTCRRRSNAFSTATTCAFDRSSAVRYCYFPAYTFFYFLVYLFSPTF